MFRSRLLRPLVAAMPAFGASAQSSSDVTVRDPNGIRLGVSETGGTAAVFAPPTVDLACTAATSSRCTRGCRGRRSRRCVRWPR